MIDWVELVSVYLEKVSMNAVVFYMRVKLVLLFLIKITLPRTASLIVVLVELDSVSNIHMLESYATYLITEA